MLPDRIPQVTFSCDSGDETCAFQFWVGGTESFYCALDTCSTHVTPGYDFNLTQYACEHVKCSCVPGRFLCGEDGSISKFITCLSKAWRSLTQCEIDLDDFLSEEIKGPASFSCRSEKDCRFEEPAMNDLIMEIFGDSYISLVCDGGECLHYSQVPGYVVNNSLSL